MGVLYLVTVLTVTLSGSFHFGYQIGAFNGASVHVRSMFNTTMDTRYCTRLVARNVTRSVAWKFGNRIFGINHLSDAD